MTQTAKMAKMAETAKTVPWRSWLRAFTRFVLCPAVSNVVSLAIVAAGFVLSLLRALFVVSEGLFVVCDMSPYFFDVIIVVSKKCPLQLFRGCPTGPENYHADLFIFLVQNYICCFCLRALSHGRLDVLPLGGIDRSVGKPTSSATVRDSHVCNGCNK